MGSPFLLQQQCFQGGPLAPRALPRFLATMGLSDSRPEPFPRLLIPSGRWGSVALPRPAGSPRFLDCSIPARCPQSPRKVRRVLAHCFPADIRLHPIWRIGYLHWCHEAESGSLALRLTGLLPRFPPDGLRSEEHTSELP